MKRSRTSASISENVRAFVSGTKRCTKMRPSAQTAAKIQNVSLAPATQRATAEPIVYTLDEATLSRYARRVLVR